MTTLNADMGTEPMSAALMEASDRLEAIESRNGSMADEFETQGWQLDRLRTARSCIDMAREQLTTVAELIGIGGREVRDAHLSNAMVGEKNTVTE